MEFRLKEVREEMGLTQEELAEKADVSRTIISGLETGAITVTTTGTLVKIANALGKKVSDIFLA
jgi:DNA-binding XRE family transcriptional regulator